MNTDYYNIKKISISSSNSSESNYSPRSNCSKNSNNKNRINDYPFCYNLCCFCTNTRKKIETEKNFII